MLSFYVDLLLIDQIYIGICPACKDCSAVHFPCFSLMISVFDHFEISEYIGNDIWIEREVGVARPDLIKFTGMILQALEGCDAGGDIPVQTEHINISVSLYRITADQNPA